MARDFKAVDRDTPMLLPPDLRDWLPQGHLAYLVLAVVEQLDLSAIIGTYRRGGTGREAFDPAMLTALLIYAYAQGVRSSRQIERDCVTDVAMRLVAAQQRPDHSTLARFRQRHAAALADLFGQVLGVCGRAGLGRVGIVAVDGTKIAGQASPRKNYDEATLHTMAAGIVAEAEATDAAEDAEHGPDRSGDELPESLRPGPDRAARIRQALQQVQAERAAAQAADEAAAERKVARARRTANRERRDRQRQQDSKPARADRRPVDQHAKVRRADARVAAAEEELAQARAGQGRQVQTAKPRANLSDPESRLMFVRGKGYLQGYNAQLGVSDDHLIVAADVFTDTNDMLLFSDIMNQAVANVAAHLDGARIGTVLADAGYCTHDALTTPGPDRLIATGRRADRPSQGGRDPAIAQMAERLAAGSPDRQTYKRRQVTVEPVIGHLKDRLGLRRFLRRGQQAAQHELRFAATVHNIRRLATA
jgi:transposase